MTETQVLRAVRASVDAHGIYVTANRIGVTHSTLTRYLAGMHCQAHVVERIATFAGKPLAGPPKGIKKPKPAKKGKPAKKAKASKKSKPKKAKKAKPAKAKAKPSKKKPSKKKASKPKAKAPPAPASSPTVVDEDEAPPAAAE